MRKCMALFSALALFASSFFFAYLEAERLSGWPEAAYRSFDPRLPLVMILTSSIITIGLPCIIGLFSEENAKITED